MSKSLKLQEVSIYSQSLTPAEGVSYLFYKTWCHILIIIWIFEYFCGWIFESTFSQRIPAVGMCRSSNCLADNEMGVHTGDAQQCPILAPSQARLAKWCKSANEQICIHTMEVNEFSLIESQKFFSTRIKNFLCMRIPLSSVHIQCINYRVGWPCYAYAPVIWWSDSHAIARLQHVHELQSNKCQLHTLCPKLHRPHCTFSSHCLFPHWYVAVIHLIPTSTVSGVLYMYLQALLLFQCSVSGLISVCSYPTIGWHCLLSTPEKSAAALD